MTILHFTFQGRDYSLPLSEAVQETILPSSPWLRPDGSNYVLSPDFFSLARRVPDKQRYTLECLAGRWELLLMNGEPATQQRFTSAFDSDEFLGPAHIVLLLESPHVDEYTQDFDPIGPAQGATGKGIHRYLASHVLPMLIHAGLHLLPERPYNLCIVNPIPYQTSLGHALSELNASLRNSIWLKLWEDCWVDFEWRLSDYEPEIIMNGCTSVAKRKVTESVRAYPQPIQHFNINHPAVWSRALKGFHKV